MLETAVRRIERYLRRRGLLKLGRSDDAEADGEAALAASAVSGRQPPAGPQWLRGLAPLAPSALAFDKPLCASLDGFTLHAATRAGALDVAGREALLRYGRPSPKSASNFAQTGWCASLSSALTPTAPSRLTWIRCRCSVGSRPACRPLASTP